MLRTILLWLTRLYVYSLERRRAEAFRRQIAAAVAGKSAKAYRRMARVARLDRRVASVAK